MRQTTEKYNVCLGPKRDRGVFCMSEPTSPDILHYITCHLLDAFIQSDLHTRYCGQSPQEQFGVKCLRDTTTCWLQWILNLWRHCPAQVLFHINLQPSGPQTLPSPPFTFSILCAGWHCHSLSQSLSPSFLRAWSSNKRFLFEFSDWPLNTPTARV